jgi:hypothetical protein
MSSGIFSVILNQQDYLQGTVTTGGQLIGWVYPKTDNGKFCWTFLRDISDFYDATEVAGALTIKGKPENEAYAMIRWNAVPMTEEQLNDVENGEGNILNPGFPVAAGAGGNKQGQRNLAWIVEAGLPIQTGYQGAQAGVAHFYGFTGNQNELLIQYLQLKLTSTNSAIVGLQAEMAQAVGATSWNGVGLEISSV